ncbi:type II toxin-antitoxin system RelE/ParE family toxin [Thioclava electrotropha]|uniref:Type II toxin-antitoxin system RelE/ParE family toxin n=1 Tax=Thioclava electrotropha TaxID=1549850 RepID=A0ABX6Z041_9RHOB|nr:type II toxin-antitoxin system RelE/ParE family toxin [Thioclava electrotropha]MPQ96152.1 type II toxin-antitoxin system RelE/ParE family toxin [Thioclava sp. JE_KL1]QPZ93410.1 type II toxin-antitoxin system RelE/ParE family toxin [Thioclava electrotropha]
MTRSLRLTRRAQQSLVAIAQWTIARFGQRQSEIYEAELIERCEAIVAGQAHSQSCAILVDDAEDLRFARAGEHFLVFLDTADEVIIIDILHARSDLPRHVAALTAMKRDS